MSSRRKKTKIKKPHFPRRLWSAGHKPRTEKPKKGKGASYDRSKIRKETRQDMRGLPDEV